MAGLTGLRKLEGNKKLFGLDHLRALAIILVFVFHYGRIFPHPGWTNSISKFGWTGVDLFFVLSGYLISSQLFIQIAQQEKLSFRRFFLKRFFRIIPAYIVVVALYFLLPSARERESLAPTWKYLTFTQNFGLDIRSQGTFSHAWSLCIEEQFYLLLPIILIILVYFDAVKRGLFILIALFAIGLFIRWYSWNTLVNQFGDSDDFSVNWYRWIYYPTYSRLDGLLMGVSIAAIFQFKPVLRSHIEKYGNLFLIAGLLVLAAAYFLCLDEESFGASVFGFPLVSFGYGLMVTGAISPSAILYRFNSKLIATIARLSYATYLTHKIIIHITQEQLAKLDIDKSGNYMFVICIITSLAAALILNKIVEKPFLKMRDRLLQAKRNIHQS